MLDKRAYHNAYQESKNRLDFLKYGLINEYGEELSRVNNNYKLEEIIKKQCNHKYQVQDNKAN